MKISAIVAVGLNGEIGLTGKMLWNYPSEYQHFIQTISGHHIVMGRVNWDDNQSNDRMLSRVSSLIISQKKNYIKNHIVHSCYDVTSFEEVAHAVEFARNAGESELFIIGGAQLYQYTMKMLDRIYYSVVPFSGKADTFFPKIHEQDFKLVYHNVNKATGDSPQWDFYLYERQHKSNK